MAFMVGISGATRSGKSTLAEDLSLRIGASVVSQDNFFVDKHEYPMIGRWRNYDSPDGVKHDELYNALDLLKRGMPAEVPDYDKKQLRRVGTYPIRSTDIVIAEGFLLFHEPRTRDIFDVRMHMTVPVDVQRERRIQTSGTKPEYFNEVILPMQRKYGDFSGQVDAVLDGTLRRDILMDNALACINSKLI